MIHVRKSEDRGFVDLGWLKSRHSFSFGEYYDRNHMGFSVLRVINEDRIEGGSGFETHGHKDMEIISYVISGGLQHKDSMGNTTTIRPGEVQVMSAGTGVMHSEFNALSDVTSHFLQIWILPDRKGYQPRYGQKDFSKDLELGEMILVASRDGRVGSIPINQDADLYVMHSSKNGEFQFNILAGHRIWIQVVSGCLNVNEYNLETGDGIGIEELSSIAVCWKSNAKFIIFDLFS